MALTTYTELQTAVAAWLHRSDLSSAQVQEFIRLAEEQITADLAQCAFMQHTPAVLALTPPATSVSLAADATSLISARLVEDDSLLHIVSAEEFSQQNDLDTGTPTMCAITGGTDAGLLTLSFWPEPSSAYTVRVTYVRAIPALSGSLAANFVLTRAPSLYLYGSLIASEAFMVNDPRMLMWRDMYDRALLNFRSQGWAGDVMLSTDLPITRGRAYSILEG